MGELGGIGRELVGNWEGIGGEAEELQSKVNVGGGGGGGMR